MIKTHEGAVIYEHCLDHAVSFFSKAGSLFENRSHFYEGSETALSLFQKTWIVDKEISMKLLFWLRDIRGGSGNRSGFRSCLTWLCNNDPKWVIANLNWIIEVGRWDDLRSCFGTSIEYAVSKFWVEGLKDNQTKVLAAKWADRKDKPLQKVLHTNEAGLRKYLASIRKEHIVESKMCSKTWNEINYEQVPSVAMSRYTNAFTKNDGERFEQFKEDVSSGKKEIKAKVLFPHDCIRTAIYGDTKIADAQFDALPNYLEGVDERIIVLSDTSGSMDTMISGSIQAIHVSQGLALYCSSRFPKSNPFYKKFIGFCSESKFKNWDGMSFSQAIYDRTVFDRAVGSTQIDSALKLILDVATFFNMDQDQMPTTLLIVSDMQFSSAITTGGGWGSGKKENEQLTEIEKCLQLWVKAGYKIPKIIYWNLDGYAGDPTTVNSTNTALISGFSPAILKAVFQREDFSQRAIMLKAIEKYKVNVP